MRAGSGWAPSGRNASSISASELKADGIEAAGFPADLTDRSTLPDLISAITARCGQITVLQYAPAGPDRMSRQTDVRQYGAESFEFPLDLLLRTPAELNRRLLPGMLARGRGTILFGLPATATRPYPSWPTPARPPRPPAPTWSASTSP